MDGKTDLLKPREKTIKFLEIKSNFKKARKISPTKNIDNVKNKKSVVFLEPPKGLKPPNLKKTQILRNPNPHKIISRNFNTQIGLPKKKKSKNNNKALKSKGSKLRNSLKLPSQKSKFVTINKHYFIPIITQFDSSTYINKNENALKNIKKNENNNYSKITTNPEKLFKKIDLNNKIKKIEIKQNNNNLKPKKIMRNYTQIDNNNDTENNKNNYNDNNDNILKEKKFNNNNRRGILKKSFTTKEKNDINIEPNKINKSKKSENSKEFKIENTIVNNYCKENYKKIENCVERIYNDKSEKDKDKNKNKVKIIDNKNEENKKEIDEKNKNGEKEEICDNLTNKVSTHIKNNSVDGTKKKEKTKSNNNIFKKLLCCLYG